MSGPKAGNSVLVYAALSVLYECASLPAPGSFQLFPLVIDEACIVPGLGVWLHLHTGWLAVHLAAPVQLLTPRLEVGLQCERERSSHERLLVELLLSH